MKKIAIVSHCILNTCTKVNQNPDEMIKESEYRLQFLTWTLKNEIQLLQLPCPEFIVYGSKRWGHVKEQFSHKFFRVECQKLLYPFLIQLEEYAKYPNEYDIIGVIGINGSPNCGIHFTCSGNWGGELSNPDFYSRKNTLHISDESGVFMEELQKELNKRSLSFPFYSLEDFPLSV